MSLFSAGPNLACDNYPDVNTSTYNLYLEKSWNTLIEVGSKAIENGCDYYYLRMRLGIAFYEINQYRKAVPQFEKALEFNALSDLAQEYLYYAYLFSGQRKKAQLIASEFSNALQQKIKPKKPPRLTNVFVEFGYTLNPDYSPLKNNNVNGNAHIIYNEYRFVRQSQYMSAGFACDIWYRWDFNFAFSRIGLDNITQIEADVPQPLNGHEKYEIHSKTVQDQLYINANLGLDWGMMFSVAFHGFMVDLTNSEYSQNNSVGNRYTFESESFNENVYFLGIKKSFIYFDTGISSVLADFKMDRHVQPGVFLTYYPLGNSKIYLDATIDYHMSDDENTLVYNQIIGGQVFEYLWIEGLATIGEVQGYVDRYAFVVFNDTSRLKNRFGLSVIIPFKQCEFTIRYRFLNRKGQYLTYASYAQGGMVDYKPVEKTVDFINHSIIGGIKWTF